MANQANQPQKKLDKKQSTQMHLPIAEIRNGVIILKDGSLRLVLLVSTVNFDLKNKQEQDALTYGFQDFINSLDYPIQITMQSRKIDLSVYLTRLRARLSQIENPLLQIQTEDYIAFVEKLISVANIMNKRFYVIIPYFPPALKQTQNFFQKLKFSLSSNQPVVDITNFEKYRKEIIQRAQSVASGLGSLGLRAIQLSTQELIELLYQTYNPELAVREKLIPIEKLSGPVSQTPKQPKPTAKPDQDPRIQLPDPAQMAKEKQTPISSQAPIVNLPTKKSSQKPQANQNTQTNPSANKGGQK